MEYHVFWIVFALIWPAYNNKTVEWQHAHDCYRFGEITQQEVKAEVLTCYVKRDGKWIERNKL